MKDLNELWHSCRNCSSIPRKSGSLGSLWFCKDFVSNFKGCFKSLPAGQIVFLHAGILLNIDTRFFKRTTPSYSSVIAKSQKHEGKCLVIQREGKTRERRALDEKDTVHCVKCCVVLMYTLETLNVSVFSSCLCGVYRLAHEILLLQNTQRPRNPHKTSAPDLTDSAHICISDVSAGVVFLTNGCETPALMSQTQVWPEK